MNNWTPEPWGESTGEPDFKTNYPEPLGYMGSSDKKRAVRCVNFMENITNEQMDQMQSFQNLMERLDPIGFRLSAALDDERVDQKFKDEILELFNVLPPELKDEK